MRISLPLPQPNIRQAALATLAFAVGLALFLLLERGVTPRYSLALPVDRSIPFLAWSWFVYMGFFPFVIALVAYAQPQAFSAFRQALRIALVIGIACFLLFPEAIPRPDLAGISNEFMRHRFDHMWQLDLAENGFPSLHVVVTCLACRMLPARRHRALASVIGMLICASTLTIKQHTVADVAGGVLLAMACAYWVERRSLDWTE
ncbi:MAG: phosphatase PAP2 family protein [Gallionellaceae bacterium]|jgi:membrane-associated phospholipid phosphatase|nr:phosphatase PAP2 family protein [Gallionellaceae bacterium]